MIPYTACYNPATIAIVTAIIIAASPDTVTDTNAHADLISTTAHWLDNATDRAIAVLSTCLFLPQVWSPGDPAFSSGPLRYGIVFEKHVKKLPRIQAVFSEDSI